MILMILAANSLHTLPDLMVAAAVGQKRSIALPISVGRSNGPVVLLVLLLVICSRSSIVMVAPHYNR
jgi:hypothetical protein